MDGLALAAALLDLAQALPPLLRIPSPTLARLQANGLAGVASAAALQWGEPVKQLHPPPDLVLASDVLYQAQALPLFVRTLAALSGPGTLTLLCNEHRPALPFPGPLFAAAGFAVRRVPLREQHPDWSSEDIHLYEIRLAEQQLRPATAAKP